jgi:hypothetical protein
MNDIAKSLNEIVECYGLEGFKDPFWTLGQVLAWVETRSPFAVDMLSDTDALSKRAHSMPPTMPHYAAEWAARCAAQYGLAQFASPYSDAQQIYLDALRPFKSGKLLAWRQENGSRQTLSIIEWIDLGIGDNSNGEVVVLHRGTSHAAYRDVRVEREAVLEVFEPMAAVEPADRSNDRVGAYCEWVAQNVTENKMPSRDDCLAHMRTIFPDIRDDDVRDLRKGHAPAAWKAPGRRPIKTA